METFCRLHNVVEYKENEKEGLAEQGGAGEYLTKKKAVWINKETNVKTF